MGEQEEALYTKELRRSRIHSIRSKISLLKGASGNKIPYNCRRSMIYSLELCLERHIRVLAMLNEVPDTSRAKIPTASIAIYQHDPATR